MIGSYGLTSLALGITEVSMSKKENLLFFFPIFGLIYIWTAFIVGNVIWSITRFGFDYYPLWWLHLILHLIPSIMVSVIGFLNFARKSHLSRAVKKKSIRIASHTTMITLPLVSAAVLWLLLTLTWRTLRKRFSFSSSKSTGVSFLVLAIGKRARYRSCIFLSL